MTDSSVWNFAIAVYLRASDESASSFKTTELQDEFRFKLGAFFVLAWRVLASSVCKCTFRPDLEKTELPSFRYAIHHRIHEKKKSVFFCRSVWCFFVVAVVNTLSGVPKHPTSALADTAAVVDYVRKFSRRKLFPASSSSTTVTRARAWVSLFQFYLSIARLPWIGMAMPFHLQEAITYCVDRGTSVDAVETNASFCFCFIRPSLVSCSLAPGRMFGSDKYLYTLCRLQSVNCKHRLSIFCMLGFGKW